MASLIIECDFMIEILSKYFAVLNTESVIQFHAEVQNPTYINF